MPLPLNLDRNVAGLAVAVGVVALGSVASLALFFAVGTPFGAINDWTVGVVGFLSGLLSVMLHRRRTPAPSGLGTAAIGAAVMGAVIVVVGAALVISRTTGFFLAGLVESLGLALIGLWLIALNRSIASASRWPRPLPRFGMAAGIIMAIGFAVVPGIAAIRDVPLARGAEMAAKGDTRGLAAVLTGAGISERNVRYGELIRRREARRDDTGADDTSLQERRRRVLDAVTPAHWRMPARFRARRGRMDVGCTKTVAPCPEA